MSLQLTRNKTIGIKLETSNGTKETLTVSDYGLECTDISANNNLEMIEKNVFRSSISATAGRVGKVSCTVEISGEFKNSGVANTKPKIDTVLQTSRFLSENVKAITVSGVTGSPVRGCTVVKGNTSNATGLVVAYEGNVLYYIPRTGNFNASETVSGTGFSFTSSTAGAAASGAGYLYSPSSTPATEKTATLVVNESGTNKISYGAASTFKLSLSTSDIPKYTASYTAICDKNTWGDKIDAVSGIVYESNNPPVVVNAQLKIGNVTAPVVSQVDLDIGNTVSLIENLNSDSWYNSAVVTNRAANGSISILSDADIVDALYSQLFAGTTAELSFKIGSGAGNQIDIICPAVQYQSIAGGDSNGFVSQAINVKLTGDDKEMLIWFR